MVWLATDFPWQLPFWERLLSQGLVYHPVLLSGWTAWPLEPGFQELVIWFGVPYNVQGTQVYIAEDISSHLEASIAWCEALGVRPCSFMVSQVLAFLQQGIARQLALRTNKGSFCLCSPFLTSLGHVFLHPRGSSYGISCVLLPVAAVGPELDSLLPEPPLLAYLVFSPSYFFLKVASLVAITSVPYSVSLPLFLHKDKVVLRPCPSFSLKVSDFHLNA